MDGRLPKQSKAGQSQSDYYPHSTLEVESSTSPRIELPTSGSFISVRVLR